MPTRQVGPDFENHRPGPFRCWERLSLRPCPLCQRPDPERPPTPPKRAGTESECLIFSFRLAAPRTGRGPRSGRSVGVKGPPPGVGGGGLLVAGDAPSPAGTAYSLRSAPGCGIRGGRPGPSSQLGRAPSPAAAGRLLPRVSLSSAAEPGRRWPGPRPRPAPQLGPGGGAGRGLGGPLPRPGLRLCAVAAAAAVARGPR